MEELSDVLVPRDLGHGNGDTHKNRPTADEYGVINVRAEQFRRVKLEQYAEPSKVRVETIVTK